jgi:glycosyltransferase involved in cell wall biosynthesis
MRLLHVGSGFRPWRRGGLVAYTEDLMDEQVRRGHEVAYFFAGRQYPLARGPRLRRWRQRGVRMLEVVDSPLYDHGRQPGLELAEPRVERLLDRELRALRPDVVHVHELAGLPSSVLDVLGAAGVPSVFTLQDYFPLCPAFKLLDADGRVCMRRDVGADCLATTAADPRDAGLMIEETLNLHARRAPLVRSLDPWRISRYAQRVARAEVARRRRRAPEPAVTAAAFQRRRDVNVERLNRVDLLIAMSHRVEEIYRELGVEPSRLRTLHLTLRHIERLTPRHVEPQAPLTFATLAGFEYEAKGAHLLIEAMRRLGDDARAGRVRLVVLGHVDPRLRAAADGVAGIEVRGRYAPADLDRILDGVDVGLMPSTWEEAYGYAGVEFLAKGIPVVANAIGGMTDYTREGETGWLNRSCSGRELAEIMSSLARRPDQVAERSASVLARRGEIVTPIADHAGEMDAVYREAIAGVRAPA